MDRRDETTADLLRSVLSLLLAFGRIESNCLERRISLSLILILDMIWTRRLSRFIIVISGEEEAAPSRDLFCQDHFLSEARDV